MSFSSRVKDLPWLGVGVSTEYGARSAELALDPFALRRQRPEFAEFLELGVELHKGLDQDAERWVHEGWPTTYHFLDINLDEAEDFDAAWLAGVKALTERVQPAWLCGDAGLWHFGPRERGQMLLLPPILSKESAQAQARGIATLRGHTGLEVLPENPPGQVFIGDLHLMDYFGQVCEAGDTGMVLDCAHLAIYQQMMGHAPLERLEGFDLGRVVELHVAGGKHITHEGLGWIDDDHSPEVLDDTWEIFEWVVARASNLKAVVFECERNANDAVGPGFERIRAVVDAAAPVRRTARQTERQTGRVAGRQTGRVVGRDR